MTNKTPANALRYKQRCIIKMKPYFYGETLLDAGCGEGETSSLLLNDFKTITAFDIERNVRWKEFSNERLSFSAGDAEKIGHPDNSFDTVIAKDVLHHVNDPEKALKELVRVSKKRVLILEANRYNPLFYINMTLIQNHQHFRFGKFKKIMKSAGLPVKIRRFSARVCPVNKKPIIDLFDKVEDFLEWFILYRPIIEYNLGILTKE